MPASPGRPRSLKAVLTGPLLPLALGAVLVAWGWLRSPAPPPDAACAQLRPDFAGRRGAPASAAAGLWPTEGEGIHTIFTSNGAPYVNYQTLVLLGTFRLARRQPDGHRLVALTRILHRTSPDELSPLVPTFRTEPLRPACDGKARRQLHQDPGNPGGGGGSESGGGGGGGSSSEACGYVVAERPGAAPWLLLIETDYLFVGPVPAPGPAEDPSVRPLAAWFGYISPHVPGLRDVMRSLYPQGMGPLSDIPRTGPAPVLARPADWLAVLPRWEGLTAQMVADPLYKERLGWVREMYAFAIAVAIERLPLEVVAPPNSTLMAQPPADLTLGRSAMIHYTWGPKLLLASDGSEAWRFEKRDLNTRAALDEPRRQLLKPALPPPFEEGRFKTPSAVRPEGAPTLREHYAFFAQEVQLVRAAIDEVGGAAWRATLAREAAAAAAQPAAAAALGGQQGAAAAEQAAASDARRRIVSSTAAAVT